MLNRTSNAQWVPGQPVGAGRFVLGQLLTLPLLLILISGCVVGKQGPNQLAGKQTGTNKAVPQLGERWTNSLGMSFAPVPGTKVLFGIWDVRVKDYAVYAAAVPGVNERWKSPGFAQDGTHPVTMVSWEDAKAFCAWLTKKEQGEGKLGAGQEYRLPTDAEWSYAVGIGNKEGNGTPSAKDMKLEDVYPWGNQWPPPKGAGNYSASLKVDDFEYTSPVGSFKANQYGLYDMGGNVWQWCEDWYDTDQKRRVLRGASWYDGNPDLLLSSSRDDYTPDLRRSFIGFRVVAVVGSER
ncbi:MAG: SUMF1/EgtB/PvdO family nonheme iron enzyme [Verrucomicrobiota bacterium]